VVECARVNAILLDTARALYRERRLRARYFAGSLFAEPTWDMLLDLFIADCERRRVTLKSVCIGSNVPTTTAMRHLRWLHEQGLVERLSHPSDARSSQVRLTAKALTAMEAYLTEI
jgi:Winged helix DNA-binding domain